MLDSLPASAREEDNMEIQLADVTLHFIDGLDADQRAAVEQQLRDLDGVVSVHNPEKRPHLTMVQYNTGRLNAAKVLETVRANGHQVDMIGL
jgi:hypothetical protein